MKSYKYTARFESIATCLIDEEADRFLAKASLENLKPLLPKDVDWDSNPDLLPVVANGTVINRANKNGHLITFDKAVGMARNSRYKLLDTEHLRKDICGVIVSAGFSKFGSSELLSEDDIKDKKDPFNMSICAAVWKVARPKLVQKIVESSDPESDWYRKISFSWECGFNEFQLLVGSKNLIDGELITDEAKIKELVPYLMRKNKDGKESRMGFGKGSDGKMIYTVIIDPILLGYGLTLNPAADVEGLLTVGDNITLTEEDEEENDDASITTSGISTAIISTEENNITTTSGNANIVIIEKDIVAAPTLENPPATSENEPKPLVTETVASENAISHKNNPCVKEGNMKIVSKEDLRAKLLEAKVGEEVIASAVTYFNDELEKAGKAYEAEKSAKDLALSEVKAQGEKTKTDLAAVQTQLETANKALIELQAAKAQKEKDDAFQTRMAGLDSEYDFDADLKKVVASQIKDLDEAGYKNWFDGFKVIASAKKKGAAPAKTEVAAVLDPKVIAEQALANATVVSTPIPNAATTTASIKDKYKLSKEDYQVK